MLSAAFWVFQVVDGVEIVEADLFEQTFLGGRFVEGKKVGTKDEVEGFPLLHKNALMRCVYWRGKG